MIEVKVKLNHPYAKLPVQAHSGDINYPTDAGFDIFAAESCRIETKCVAKIKTGIVLELPVGVEAQIWPRSSDMLCNMFVHLGTIDPGYRGELIVLARMFPGSERDELWVKPGDRVGQLKFVSLTPCELSITERVNETERGEDGFGSTGRGAISLRTELEKLACYMSDEATIESAVDLSIRWMQRLGEDNHRLRLLLNGKAGSK